MEENVENVVEKTTKDNITKVDLKQTKQDDNVIKVNLDKPPTPKEDEVKEEVTKDNADDSGVVELVEDADTTEKQEEVQPEAEAQETPVLEEITEEEVQEQTEELTEQVEEAIEQAQEPGQAFVYVVQSHIFRRPDQRTFPIQLREESNFLIMHANDLGDIAPNTVALSIDDGVKEQRLIVSSNLAESGAVLIKEITK